MAYFGSEEFMSECADKWIAEADFDVPREVVDEAKARFVEVSALVLGNDLKLPKFNSCLRIWT